MILWPHDIVEKSLSNAGGKAFALAQSVVAGLPVPAFFAVENSVVKKGKLDKMAKAAIEQAVQQLVKDGATLFAVRSSALSEDGAETSHAGQFLTKLNVAPEAVGKAIEAVVASGERENVNTYRQARGVHGQERPAVIIQSQIDAHFAGVAFSADPVSGRRDRVVVSAVEGLGESLVSGEADGENWQIGKSRDDIFLRPLLSPLLSEEQAKAIAHLALQCEARKTCPQDIEWAIDQQGKLWHLQDRPITTRLLPLTPWETELTVLDNSNIVESYPGLVSPLTFSFAAMAYQRVYLAFLKMIGTRQRAIEGANGFLANMLVHYQGRMYYNLGSWYRLLSFLPFFSKNRSNMETMMGVSSPIPDEAIADVGAPSKPALIRMLAYLGVKACIFPWMRKRFYQRMQKAMPDGAASRDIEQMPLSKLAQEYRRLEAALLDRWDAPILNDVLCMMAYGGSRKYLEKEGGAQGIKLHNEEMIGQGDIISAEPAQLIRHAGNILATSADGIKKAVKDGDAATAFKDPILGPLLRDYINRFGDRRIGELKLESPTLADDPAPLFAAVDAAAQKEHHNEVAKIDTALLLDEIFGKKFVKKSLARFLLSYAKARVRDRENLRFERTRIFARARRIFVEMGKRLVATGQLEKADDIFLLEIAEALGTAEGFAGFHDLTTLVKIRRNDMEKQAKRADPPERIVLRGSVGDAAALLTPFEQKNAFNDDKTLEKQGLACGSGTVEGRARIIRDPLCEQLKAGEILVARNTDPGWISHFVNAAAVVVERGSVLSHSAIVSRELGIPCVVGVKNATQWLQDGDLIEVDGGNGIVRKLNG